MDSAAAWGEGAQPALGRFAGNSRYWRPDDVGTLRMRSSGALSFTATAEVELQRQPEAFPGSGMDTYEMRGLITLTSPLQTTPRCHRASMSSSAVPSARAGRSHRRRPWPSWKACGGAA